MSEVGILGAGGMAREAALYLFESPSFFAVNKEFLPKLARDNTGNFIDIEEPNEFQKKIKVVAALGAPALRKTMVDMWPGINYANIIAESAEVYTKNIGQGIIIAPKTVVTDNVEIGNHTIINVGATVSHDCTLGQYVTISPGAHIAGNVKLEDGVFIGIGATVSNGITIAEGSVIGAGAVVVRDVINRNSVMVGNPARKLRDEEGWLRNV